MRTVTVDKVIKWLREPQVREELKDLVEEVLRSLVGLRDLDYEAFAMNAVLLGWSDEEAKKRLAQLEERVRTGGQGSRRAVT